MNGVDNAQVIREQLKANVDALFEKFFAPKIKEYVETRVNEEIADVIRERLTKTLSDHARYLIDRIEQDHCLCGARLDRTKPKTWEHCGIHKRCEELRVVIVGIL